MKKIIITIVVIAILSIIAFPLINFYITTPSFTKFIVSHTEKDLVDVAAKISSEIDIHETIFDDMVLGQKVIDKISKTKSLFNLEKIKVFY